MRFHPFDWQITSDYREEELTQTVPMPRCAYDLLEADNATKRFGLIGQHVTHKWTCTTATRRWMGVYWCCNHYQTLLVCSERVLHDRAQLRRERAGDRRQ